MAGNNGADPHESAAREAAGFVLIAEFESALETLDSLRGKLEAAAARQDDDKRALLFLTQASALTGALSVLSYYTHLLVDPIPTKGGE